MSTHLPSLSSLEVGDFVPPFCLPDQDGHLREIHLYAGRVTVLSFVSVADEPFLAQYLHAVAQRENDISAADFGLLPIVAASPGQLVDIKKRYDTSKLGLTSLYWSDEQRHVSRMFNVGGQGGCAFVLSRNHQILARITAADGADMLAQAIVFVQHLPKPQQAVFDAQSHHAPVLVIPNAISPELCTELLSFWQTSQKYQGTIGSAGTEKVVLSGKRRMDADIRDTALLTRIDQSLSKSVFSELRKVAAVEIGYRERYKLGAYDSQDQGFYNQHRDTGHHLAYRRYSMSLSLADGYEGGLLQFPEYDFCAYKLPARCAAVFPSTLLHGVTPVTSGMRFVMVSFFFTEAEAVLRRAKGTNIDETKLLCASVFEDTQESKGFYTSSLRGE